MIRSDDRDPAVLAWAVAALPASFIVWNPWGLIGRHEIRLLIGWAAVCLCVRTLVRSPDSLIPRRWPLAVGFLVLLAISTIAAWDWRTTIIGHADRHLGVLGWLSLGAAVFIGINLGNISRNVFRTVLECASVFVAVFALGQLLSPAVFGEVGPGGRPTSSFGSATYTGAALALALPFLVQRALCHERRLVRRIALVSAGTTIAALVATGSRGAWIGGVVGLAGVAWTYRREQRHRVAIFAAMSVAAVAAIVALSGTVRDRIATLADPTAGTAGGRLVLWQSGLRASLERPLQGWGPDRTRVGLPPALPQSFEAKYWDQTVPDRAHNIIIDIAVTLGIPAAVLVGVGLCAALVVVVRRHILWAPTATTVWAIAWIAHVPHLMFNFLQLDIDLTAAVVFGVAIRPMAVSWRPPLVVRANLSAAASIGLVVSVLFGGGLVVADTLAASAVRAEQRGDADKAAARYATSATFAFGDARYYELITRFERRRGNLIAAIAAADEAASRHRSDPFFGELPALTRAEATQIDERYADEAIAMYGDLIAAWPNHGAYYTGLGVTEVLRGNTSASEAAFLRAIELSPLSPEPYLNLARLYSQLGDVHAARTVLDAGIERSVEPESLEAFRTTLP